MRRNLPGSCASDASGHAAAAPPNSAMSSRRLIDSPPGRRNRPYHVAEFETCLSVTAKSAPDGRDGSIASLRVRAVEVSGQRQTVLCTPAHPRNTRVQLVLNKRPLGRAHVDANLDPIGAVQAVQNTMNVVHAASTPLRCRSATAASSPVRVSSPAASSRIRVMHGAEPGGTGMSGGVVGLVGN